MTKNNSLHSRLEVLQTRFASCNAIRISNKGQDIAYVAIDIYDQYLCVWNYHPKLTHHQLHQELQSLLQTINNYFPYIGIVFKRSAGDTHQENNLIVGRAPSDPIIVKENNLFFYLNLNKGSNTGLFLDHRNNRKLVLDIAKGKRVANLFAYTGGFTVAAMLAKCEVVFSIDVAASHLKQIQANLSLNHISDVSKSKLIEFDVINWLGKQTKKAKFDLIICDPPVSGSAKHHFKLDLSTWRELITKCKAIAHNKSQFIFCNNIQSDNQNNYYKILLDNFNDVKKLALPEDLLAAKPLIAHHYLCK